MMPLPLIRGAQTSGSSAPPGGGDSAVPPGPADLLGPSAGQPSQSPQEAARARMEQVRRIDQMVDDIASQSPESAQSAKKVKDALKEWMLRLVKNSTMGEAQQPKVLG